MKSNNIIKFLFSIVVLLLAFQSCKKDDDSDDSTNNHTQDNNSSVGSAANAILSDDYYEKLTLEILYMPGTVPNDNSVNNIKSFLLSHVNKPLGIDVVMNEVNSSGQSSYSSGDIENIETQYRQHFNSDKTIATCMIFVDGEYAENDQVLGIAYKNTSMAIFGKTVADNSGGISQPTKTKLESTVMNHEMAHLLGLVDIGSPMVENHKDSNNGSHCNNDECLMYYASETTEIASFLIGNDVPELDQNCNNDLIANGGK
ncbi:MAG: hypothetical protein WED10_13220 [Brumimicrobium sp.]